MPPPHLAPIQPDRGQFSNHCPGRLESGRIAEGDQDEFKESALLESIICEPHKTNSPFKIHTLLDFPSALPDDISLKGKMLLVIDKSLPRSIISPICRLFVDSGCLTRIIELNIRKGKNLDALVKVWAAMVEFSPELTVGIGGGTISDVVGFAASTYKRGSSYILFPTTTLAMVDACVSGKTGIDFLKGKNIIGALHYPMSVVNIVSVLQSMPIEEYRSGFAEVVKLGIAASPKLLVTLDQWARLPPTEQRTRIAEIIHQAITVKAEILALPSANQVKPLYGHMIGVAIELLGPGYRRHGDCVSVGMVVEGLLACRLGIWKLEEWEYQLALLQALLLPTNLPPDVSLDQVLSRLEMDKHATEEAIRFVFPERIGSIAQIGGSFYTPISRKQMRQVLEPVYTELSNRVKLTGRRRRWGL